MVSFVGGVEPFELFEWDGVGCFKKVSAGNKNQPRYGQHQFPIHVSPESFTTHQRNDTNSISHPTAHTTLNHGCKSSFNTHTALCAILIPSFSHPQQLGITTIGEAKEIRGMNLIAAHSHIRGLGIDTETLETRATSQGLVGQHKARKAAAVILQMVKEGKIAGRAVLIAGPPR